MAFDQAQSARLGQRTPLENPGIRIVQTTADVGAPYLGQLVFATNDTTVYIYAADGWTAVGGSGGGGGGSNGTDLIFNFTVASNVWLIEHNVNEQYVDIVTIDSGGDEVIGDVDYIDNNIAQVNWYYPMTGKAIVRR